MNFNTLYTLKDYVKTDTDVLANEQIGYIEFTLEHNDRTEKSNVKIPVYIETRGCDKNYKPK